MIFELFSYSQTNARINSGCASRIADRIVKPRKTRAMTRIRLFTSLASPMVVDRFHAQKISITAVAAASAIVRANGKSATDRGSQSAQDPTAEPIDENAWRSQEGRAVVARNLNSAASDASVLPTSFRTKFACRKSGQVGNVKKVTQAAANRNVSTMSALASKPRSRIEATSSTFRSALCARGIR